MARNFVSADSDRIILADESAFDFARLDAFSYSFIETHDIDQLQAVLSKQGGSGDNVGWSILLLDLVYLFSFRVSISSEIDIRTDNTFSTGTARSAVVTYDGSGNASGVNIYVEGTDEALTASVDTLDADPLNNVAAQISGRNGANLPFDGLVSEVGIWDRQLSSGEAIAISGSRLSPLFFPRGLISYLPLIGRTSPEIDIVGGHNGTLTGTDQANHHRVIWPGAPLIPLVAAAAGQLMGSIAGHGGLAGHGGIAGRRGGIAG